MADVIDTMPGQRRKVRMFVWAVIVVIIIVGGWLVFRGGGEETVSMLESGDELITAADGELVSGFPKELLQEPFVRIGKSYAINYASKNVRQEVVRYASRKPLEENVLAYAEYFSQDGWVVIHEAALHNAPTFFYARKDNREVNVSFKRDAEGEVEVNLAHVRKG